MYYKQNTELKIQKKSRQYEHGKADLKNIFCGNYITVPEIRKLRCDVNTLLDTAEIGNWKILNKKIENMKKIMDPNDSNIS